MVRLVGGLGLGLGVAAVTIGCGDDLASANAGDPTAEDGGESGASAGTGESPEGGASGETGGGDADGGDTEGAASDDKVCRADCGRGGSCVRDEDGQPMCSCAPGYAAHGMRCLECTPSQGTAELAVSPLRMSFNITINGVPAPDDEYEDAVLWLRDRASGDQVQLGNTHNGTLAATVLPGTYEIVYDRQNGGNIVPRNGEAVLDQIRLTESTTLDLDIASVRVTGAILLNGAVAPDDEYEVGRLYFIDTITGDEIFVGETRAGAYAVRLVPGDYDVHYRRILGGSMVPRNGDAYLSRVTVPDDSEGAATFDIDIPVVEIAGSYTLDGSPAPSDEYEVARISLLDPRTGDEISVGETNEGTFTQRVVPGVYDILYNRKLGGNAVPVNERAVLDTVDVAAAPEFTVAIETASISGSYSLNGSAISLAPGEDGFVSLRDPATGDEIALGNLSDGAFERRVLPGTYDVIYSQLSSTTSLPANTHAKLMELDLAPGENPGTQIDVSTGAVSGTILLDGAVPPTSEYSDARLYLRNPITGDSVLLGSTREGGFTGTVIPGVYDLVYVVETAGDDVPVNQESKVGDAVLVENGTVITVDIPVVDLVGALQVDGQPAPNGNDDNALLSVRDVQTGDVMLLGGTQAGNFGTKLTEGTYVVVYQGVASTGLLPANENAGIACIELGAQ